MRKWLTALLLCALLTGMGHARAAQPFTRYTQQYFGTVSMLCLYTEEGAAETWEEVKDLLSAIDEAVSVSRPTSDIARFNALKAGEGLIVSDLTADILSIAFASHALTGGLYDPSVFPLVDAWGFSPRFNQNTYAPALPYDRPLGAWTPVEDRYIQALLPLVGFSAFTLEETEAGWRFTKHTPAVTLEGVDIQAQIDLGGLAKGYACDRVAKLLRDKGYTEGYFVCGGSSMAFLSRPEGEAFFVTVGKPRPDGGEGDHYAQLTARDTTLSSSSDTSHSRTWEGTLYCHIIDPRTGYPLNVSPAGGIQRGAATVTLLGDSAALNDALSTALCLMGPQAALDFLADREEGMVMAVYQADQDGLEVVSNLPPETVDLLSPGYRWACERDETGHTTYTGAIFYEPDAH